MTGLAWPAIRTVARHELRRRWPAVLALGLLAGLVGAVVLGSLSLARRTASAPERLVEATRLDDARVALFGDLIEPEQIAALPGVRDTRVLRQAVGQMSGESLAFTSVSAGPESKAHIFTPVVVEGRAPDPTAADEVVVAEVYADNFGLGVGDTIPLAMLTPDEVARFDTGFGKPDGPAVELEITGLVRLARAWAGGSGMAPVLGTPAFARAYASVFVGTVVLVRMEEASPAAKDRLRDELAALGRTVEQPPGAAEFPPLQVEFPARVDPSLVSAQVLVGGLVVFVLVASVAGLLAVGQGLARHHGARVDEQRIEAALGLTRGERVLARLLPALVGAGIAVTLAVAGALIAARAEPLGAIGAFEPDPGWRPDWLVVVLGGFAVAVVFLLAVAATAARVLSEGRRSGGLPRPSRVPLLARRAPILAGSSFALSAGAGGRAVPVRATLLGAVVGVVGVVAPGTFAASLDRLAAEPARYGWVADFAWVDARDPQLAEIERDPAVEAVGFSTEGQVEMPGGTVFSSALQQRKGDLAYTLLEGRAPRTPREMSVGPRLADRLGVDVGDTVRVRSASGDPVPVEVTGIVVLPPPGSGRFGESAVFTPEGLADFSNGQPFTAALIRATGPEEARALFDRYADELELIRAAPPEDVQNLLDLGPLPLFLRGFLATVAAAALAHALALMTRRRARDLAVLRVIGFTPRQVAASLLTMAGTTAVAGLVVGIPLGLAVGRFVWWEVATDAAVAGDVRLPLFLLAVLPVAVIIGAIAVALLPARRAARLRPATVLHSE